MARCRLFWCSPFGLVNSSMRQRGGLFVLELWGAGSVGVGVRFTFRFTGRAFVFSVSLRRLLLSPVLAFRFELAFLLFAFVRFVFRFPALPLFALLFALSFLFLFRFGLVSFALSTASLVFLFSFPFSLPALFTLALASEASPSFATRLTSTATVCPVFTTSPARGN